MNTKQVIVVRKFPNLRTGKYCAQVAHASMAFLTREMFYDESVYGFLNDNYSGFQAQIINHWLKNSFKKVVCYVNTEEELLELFEKAKEKGMLSHLIEDNGATEFKGVKTITALAIGPDSCSAFEGLTDHLPLF